MKIMNYECVCRIPHVRLITDMMYAQYGSSIVYYCRFQWIRACHMDTSPDVGNPRGIKSSGTSRTQDIEESLLRKVHASDPLHFTFRFLLVF